MPLTGSIALVYPKTLDRFGPAGWLVLIDGTLGRSDLDKLYRKNAPKGAPPPNRLQRPQVVGAVVGHALKLAQAGHNGSLHTLAQMADKRSQTEAKLLANLNEEEAVDKLHTYGGMQFKRQRSRMVWAALRDGRAGVIEAATTMLETLLNAAQKGEEQVIVPAPKVTGTGRQIPGLGAGDDSAKIGKLRRTLKEKDGTIAGLREQLQTAQKAQAKRRGDERRSQESQAQELAAAHQAQDEVKSLSEACRKLENEIKEAEKRIASLLDQQTAQEQALEAMRVEHEEAIAHLQRRLESDQQAWRQERTALVQRADQNDDSPHGVVLLFDAANLGAGARQAGGHVDFAALSQRLLAGRPMRRSVAFAVADPGPERERFETALRNAGIDVRWKQTQVFADGSTKADWDVGLAVEAMRWAGRAETVVVVSGDGDFLPLIDALKTRGTSVEAAGWQGRTHTTWRQAVTSFTDLDGQDLIRS